MNVGRAIAALRDGVVVYSAASGSGADAGTGPRDLQGSVADRRHPSRGHPDAGVRPARGPGSLDERALRVLGRTALRRLDGASRLLGEAAGRLDNGALGARRARQAQGRRALDGSGRDVHGHRARARLERPDLGIPVFASVALHDVNPTARKPARSRRRGSTSARDVYAKWDTFGPRPQARRNRRRVGLARVPGRARHGLTRGTLQRVRRGCGRRDLRPLPLRA